jgi:hypothetical protein
MFKFIAEKFNSAFRAGILDIISFFSYQNSRYLDLLVCTFTSAQPSVTFELFSLKFADPCKAVI